MPGLVAEGFGMIGPEALSAGVPVVAYRTGGIMEWGNTEAVCAVAPADRPAFASTIRSMTEDAARWRSLCAAARTYAEARFVPGSWARALLDMLCDDHSLGRLTKR
jgi:glycosyltransferase involved in cell wall biosynthesis